MGNLVSLFETAVTAGMKRTLLDSIIQGSESSRVYGLMYFKHGSNGRTQGILEDTNPMKAKERMEDANVKFEIVNLNLVLKFQNQEMREIRKKEKKG